MPIFVLIRKPSTLLLWANNLILSASWPAPSQCSTVLSSTRLKDTTIAHYIQHGMHRGYHNATLYSTLHVACFATRIPQCHTIYSRLHTMHYAPRIPQCNNIGCNTLLQSVCERHFSGSHCIHAHCTQYPLYHSTSCQQVAHYKSVS